jgi:hypothetical protein
MVYNIVHRWITLLLFGSKEERGEEKLPDCPPPQMDLYVLFGVK